MSLLSFTFFFSSFLSFCPIVVFVRVCVLTSARCSATSKLSGKSIPGSFADRESARAPQREELNVLKVAVSLIDLAMFVNYIVTDVVRDN